EQREADLTHRLVDVVLGQRAALADPLQRGLELLRERIEHGNETVPGVGADAGPVRGDCAPWSSIFSSSARVPAVRRPPSKQPSSASVSLSPSAVTASAAS